MVKRRNQRTAIDVLRNYNYICISFHNISLKGRRKNNHFFIYKLREMKVIPFHSLLLTVCPPGAAMNSVTIDPCLESLGQVQRAIFMRIKKADGSLNEIPVGSGAGGIEVLATWTTLKGATDGTKAVPSPIFGEPESEPGAKREYGGGNATPGGIPIVLGAEPTPFSAKFLASKQKAMKEAKKLASENMGCFLVDEHGRISGIADDDTTPTVVRPIPLQGFFVSDKGLGGYENVDYNMVSWAWFANWSDNFHITTPTDFNALIQL